MCAVVSAAARRLRVRKRERTGSETRPGAICEAALGGRNAGYCRLRTPGP